LVFGSICSNERYVAVTAITSIAQEIPFIFDDYFDIMNFSKSLLLEYLNLDYHSLISGCEDKIDLLVMLDDSAKTGEKGFKKSKEFVKLFIEWFNVAQDGTHLSVMTYSDQARVQMALPKPGSNTPPQTMNDLSATVDSLTYSGGSSSNLDTALATAAAQVFPPDTNTGRQDSKKASL